VLDLLAWIKKYSDLRDSIKFEATLNEDDMELLGKSDTVLNSLQLVNTLWNGWSEVAKVVVDAISTNDALGVTDLYFNSSRIKKVESASYLLETQETEWDTYHNCMSMLEKRKPKIQRRKKGTGNKRKTPVQRFEAIETFSGASSRSSNRLSKKPRKSLAESESEDAEQELFSSKQTPSSQTTPTRKRLFEFGSSPNVQFKRR
jgi:hypothetical protein